VAPDDTEPVPSLAQTEHRTCACQKKQNQGQRVDDVVVHDGLLAGGRTALHIMMSSATPDTVVIRIATPSIRPSPTPSSAIMNNQSAQAAPAKLW